MLVGLSIRNIILIDQLDLTYSSGLHVLTGETGAGKSILMDALGLALGMRAENRVIRHGENQAVISASFELAPAHPAHALMKAQGIDTDGEAIILKRLIPRDGPSRAFINDQPVSVNFLRQIGTMLVEIQGQFEQHGLMNPATHIHILDQFGQCENQRNKTAVIFEKWRVLHKEFQALQAHIEKAKKEEEFIRHSLEELAEFDAQPDEENTLHSKRTQLQNAANFIKGLSQGIDNITSNHGAEALINQSQRALAKSLQKLDGQLEDQLTESLAALERAALELQEAAQGLNTLLYSIETEETRLDDVEERLFTLRELARKHNVHPNELHCMREKFAASLHSLEADSHKLETTETAMQNAWRAFVQSAELLSKARKQAATKLDHAVNGELAPLKLDRAIFATTCAILPEEQWGQNGMDHISFTVITNPGEPAGPLSKIASGGELSRFLLALKVCLMATGSVPTLVFDEIDSGVGGATANAIGARLERLARSVQVMVITHSPQVAARGQGHFKVTKSLKNGRMTSKIEQLSAHDRREELARMLSGANITDQARAAADQLLNAPH